MKDDWSLFCGLLARPHEVGLGVWALTELIVSARRRLNEGKTAAHQERHRDDVPDFNAQVERAGVFGEVLIMMLMKEAGCSDEAQHYLQDGLLHSDITESQHKGQADLKINNVLVDVKTCMRENRPDRSTQLRINSRKHWQLKANGCRGYVGVLSDHYSRFAYITEPIEAPRVESWTHVHKDEGNGYFTAQPWSLIDAPRVQVLNALDREGWSRTRVHDLAFNNDDFGDTMRSAFPYIKWSLV